MLSKPNILVCTDFSPQSAEAVKAAENLRKTTHGTLHVLHVSEHTVMWDWLPSEGFPHAYDQKFEVDLLNNLRKKLEQQIFACEAKAEGHVSMGLPYSVILEEATDRKIDIIIMGHKGRSGGLFQLGSVAEKVVASSHIPVLVVKDFRHHEKLGVLVDPQGPFQDILTWSEELAYLFSAKLAVISLFPDIAARFIGVGKIGFSNELLTLTSEEREQVTSHLKEAIKNQLTRYSDPSIRVEVSAEKKLAFHLLSILENEKIDTIVMKRHQAGFFEKILIGSETRRMLEMFDGNIFILPP